MQGNQAPLVFGMNISTMLQKQLDNSHPVVARSQVKWCRLATVTRVAVDVDGGEQRQQLLLVATARRLEKLVLAVVAREHGTSGRISQV